MYFLMKNNIKPVYEDINNIHGGFWSIKISEKNINTFWLHIVLDFIGNNLSNKDIIKPYENANNRHVYHLYVVAHRQRDFVLNKLKKQNIFLSIQYPYPLHKMKAYENENSSVKLKNCETFSKKIFSLPIYPYLEKNKIKKIIKTLNDL